MTSPKDFAGRPGYVLAARHEGLLAAARQAQEQLTEADHGAEVAKAEFQRAVRRLHLSGASLRELAAALHLSHQRIHQIIETAGGGRRWGRHGQLPPDLTCSFCGRPQRKTRKLVTGPGIYICEKCAEMAEAVIRTGQATETALGPLQKVPGNMTQQRCGFCGKRRHQVTGLAVAGNPAGKLAGGAAICAECLILYREIHSEQLT